MKSLGKDFENFELRLSRLREESREDFDMAEKLFDEKYTLRMQRVFPRDVLGAKKYIKGQFILSYSDSMHEGKLPQSHEVFCSSVDSIMPLLPLSAERRESLKNHIIQIGELSEAQREYFKDTDDLSRDPFFALVEDFAIDGEISKEEFLLLQQHYDEKGDFLSALDTLPDELKGLFYSHIELTLSHEYSQKQGDFSSEYSKELEALKKKGINVEPVIVFVSRNYYKTPGKYRRFEDPRRRLRRTFKLALLKLLRIKLGNIDAQKIIEKFESGELFEDYFMLLFQLLEVVNENPDGEEIYSLLNIEEEAQDEVLSAEKTKEKILAGESIVTKLASLFSKAESKLEEEQLDDGLLGKILDESTDIVGEDIHFNREEDEMAGVYAEATHVEELEDEDDFDSMSPRAAYELLSVRFRKIEEDKRKSFATGEYEQVDGYNEKLVDIQVKLEKLSKVLGLEEQ